MDRDFYILAPEAFHFICVIRLVQTQRVDDLDSVKIAAISRIYFYLSFERT
jgi:hypothetical protein